MTPRAGQGKSSADHPYCRLGSIDVNIGVARDMQYAMLLLAAVGYSLARPAYIGQSPI